MNNSRNYPAGAADDRHAPWNEEQDYARKITLSVRETMMREVEQTVLDEENLVGEYEENQITLEKILFTFQELIDEELNRKPSPSRKQYLMEFKNAAQAYEREYIEVEEA